jgi:protein-S-isoprenylcysteine O-methyltransferase Ste14
VPASFAFAVVYLWLARPTARSLAAGLIISIPGLWLRALASGHVRKNEALTTSGPYAYTRNPLYLGSMIIAAGFAVAARSYLVAGIITLLFLLLYVPVILSEEDFLRSRFTEFSEYERRVPRILPRLRTSSNAGQMKFSMQLYRAHREYNAALGTVAMLAALTVKLLWLSR